MDEESIQQLYTWIDEIPLTRPKRNVSRDFSDGVLAAECVAHFIPGYVELHNYTPANNTQQKRTNWDTLNRKVFKRIDFNVPGNIINGIINCKPGVIEIVLFNLRVKVLNYMSKKEEDVREPSEQGYKDYNYEQQGDPWARNNYPQDSNLGPAPYQQYPPNMPPMQPNNQQYNPNNQHPNNQQHPHNFRNFPPAPLQNKQCLAPSMQSLAINHVESQFTQCTEDIPQRRTPRTSTLPKLPKLNESPRYSAVRFDKNVSEIRSYNPIANGIPAAIPFDGEKPRKKKSSSSKKLSKIPVHHAAESQRSRSMPSTLDNESRIYIQEKEQALMQSHETIQILQAKISRLEHLLQLKDLRIEDLDMKLKNNMQGMPNTRR